MLVRAKVMCVWNKVRQRPGSVFAVPDDAKMSTAWEVVEGKNAKPAEPKAQVVKPVVKRGAESVLARPIETVASKVRPSDETLI